MNLPKFRVIGMLTVVLAVSIIAPSAFSAFTDAVTPHFDPTSFGLPATAQEVVRKRTEKAVTFEVSPGKFASVSTGERLESPACDQATLTRLCRIIARVHDLIPYALASSEGPNSPGTAVNDSSIGVPVWSDPTYVMSSNDLSANSSVDRFGNSPTQYLVATNFGFSLGIGATINGIEVEREAQATGLLKQHVRDHSIRIVKGGVIVGTDLSTSAQYPQDGDAINTFGSPTEDWGTTWTVQDIQASDFGVAFSAKYGSLAGSGPAIPSIDHIRITVYYTEAAGAAPFFSWWSLPLMLIGCGWVLWKEGYFGNEVSQTY